MRVITVLNELVSGHTFMAGDAEFDVKIQRSVKDKHRIIRLTRIGLLQLKGDSVEGMSLLWVALPACCLVLVCSTLLLTCI